MQSHAGVPAFAGTLRAGRRFGRRNLLRRRMKFHKVIQGKPMGKIESLVSKNDGAGLSLWFSC